MFEYIRTHQRIMQGLLLLIIFPSFAFFGIESFMSADKGGSAIASVAGRDISQQEFDAAQREQLDRMRQTYGPQFDSKMLSTPEAKKNLLDELISRKALAAEVINSHLSTSDQTLQQNIMANEGMKKPDGSFDNDRYKSILATQGMTPAMYEQRQRQDLTVQQLIGAVQGTAFSPKTVAEAVSKIFEQERDIQTLNLKNNDFLAQVKVTDAMLKAYYDNNAKQFEIPELITAEYIVLGNDVLASQVSVTDAELKSFYDQNAKQFSTEEQRRASHILLSISKDASDADKKANKEKATALLAQLRSNASNHDLFAKLAKENSKDPGSAERGGDLDFFGKGAMVKPFEDAVNKLKVDEISDLVESEFGIHIIKLTAIKAASVKPFDDVKTQLAADVKKQKASKAYAEAAEIFTNTVYEQSDSLKAAADKLKLKIETVSGLHRKSNPALPPSALTNNEKFLNAIFSEDSLKKKHNTEAVEVAPATLISGRVVEYRAASKRPFDEVKAAIVAKVTSTQAALMAKQEGDAKLKALKATDNMEGFSDVKTISLLKNLDLGQDALKAVMKADIQKLPAFVGVDIPGLGYSIYRISKVAAGAPDLARRANEQQQVAGVIAQQNVYTYLEALKQKSKVVIKQAEFAAVPVKTAEK